MKILVTGSEGLIGTKLCRQLVAEGHEVVKVDVKLNFHHELGESRHGLLSLMTRKADYDGIVHLAAMTRVAACEKDAFKAVEYNVGATDAALTAAMGVQDMNKRPWVLFTSSREVYGDVGDNDCVDESQPIRPINVYSRTKALGEDLVRAARAGGLRAAIVRLSSVYGSTRDHHDRVIPAFARAAGCGGTITLNGDKVFDFVHVTDAARGLAMVCELLQRQPLSPIESSRRGLPDLHLVTGTGTSLASIAKLAKQLAAERGKLVEVVSGVPKEYEVTHFIGNENRAKVFLGWKAEISFEVGFRRLAEAYAEEEAKLEAWSPFDDIGRRRP
jgi:nucleoside-diphosphate-sugar epimerase